MKKFFSVKDVSSVADVVQEALALKAAPYDNQDLGQHKTLGLVFLNPSLRTRLSTQKAAMNLGMNVMVMNMDKDGWALETQDGVVMNGTTVEHIREAAAVMGEYCDILGLRSFPKLKDREEDYSEDLFNKFIKYCGVPVVSLESATRHPLQSLTDMITITEYKKTEKPKVVLAWAPHVKALPQAVPNSFAEWMCKAQEEGLVDFTIAQPMGYELSEEFTAGATISNNLGESLKNADFVYVKNWSSYQEYGEVYGVDEDWMMDNKKLNLTNDAKVMHCLPVRRDLELSSEILDGPNSLVIKEASNRVWAAQVVLKRMLEDLA
ncbi:MULTISPECIES: acetylornithine carbamoyltransferase [Sphingobacterium]|uniref:acetylornithine carbamoyltransferase n=1 Tax=Sphingobacterium TaxID=28453 RepID=UPI0008A305BC|nr:MULTISPECIES: acetylornithine carbamoyltransferase [Sphingobacterium]HAF36088.1 acetylornithine carbamoyltransferase [Sphingobacterium sp.]OFV08895.1 acetylornithine carbamoyltransferase [Sphingobacterium sp. HMSC13C05]HAL54544.1 acetylornithine carbamoyltransferase [Sphingobacterium sp.]HAU51991.1 acetylornithine carbamoyltransferase [Sphingobacterium sp.]HCX55958.1 acetylornithine carbamoyltransferase [Sphingobacterium sp.]